MAPNFMRTNEVFFWIGVVLWSICVGIFNGAIYAGVWMFSAFLLGRTLLSTLRRWIDDILEKISEIPTDDEFDV